MKTNITVLLDTHHWVPAALQTRATKFVSFTRLASSHTADFLSFVQQFGTKQPFRLLWTTHHEFGVRTVLTRAGWTDENINQYIDACVDLAIRSGGRIADVDYVKQAKTNQELRSELSHMGGLYGTPDLEDAAIIKMALDFRCDLIVSNDNEVRNVKAKVLVWSIQMMTNAVNNLTSARAA
jgi:hypothetical protein